MFSGTSHPQDLAKEPDTQAVPGPSHCLELGLGKWATQPSPTALTEREGPPSLEAVRAEFSNLYTSIATCVYSVG